MTTVTLLLIILFLAGLYFYIKHNYIIIEPTCEGMQNNEKGSINNGKGCPDVLIQEGSKFYLYNSRVIKVPGVNPIVFNNLEDYVEFIEWQRSQNINCPVLYLQQTLDAQGNSVYKVRPSVTNLQGGIPPNTTTTTTSKPQTNSQTNPQPNPKSYLGVPLTSVSTVPTVGDIPSPSIDGIPLPSLPNPTLLVDATQSDRPYNINSYPSYDPTSFYIGTTTPLDVMNYSQELQPVSPDPMDPNWGGPEYTQKLINQGYYNANQVKIYVGDDGN
jgi:hypothetical protein